MKYLDHLTGTDKFNDPLNKNVIKIQTLYVTEYKNYI